MAHSTSRPRTSSIVLPLARTSTVDLIAEELRSAIYAGILPVGTALREVEISSQLGVSRSPFREAAQRLVQEGLLTAVPGRGLRITQITGAGITDVYEHRLAIESQAVRRLIAEGRSGQQQYLVALTNSFQNFQRASQGDDAWAIGDADLAFHQTLVDLAGSPRLSRAMATLVIETRIISLSAQDGYAVRKSISPTYGVLLQAIEEHNVDRAIAALEKQFADAVSRLRGEDSSVDVVETPTEEEPQELRPIEAATF